MERIALTSDLVDPLLDKLVGTSGKKLVFLRNGINTNPRILIANFKYIAKREFEPRNKLKMVNFKQMNASFCEDKFLVEPEIASI